METAINVTKPADVLCRETDSRNRAEFAGICQHIGSRDQGGPAQCNLTADCWLKAKYVNFIKS